MTSPLHLTYIGHATVLIEMDGVRLMTDPLLRNRVGHIKRRGPSIDPEIYRDVDAVLLSHMHLDHLDLPSMRRLGRDTRIIAPLGVGNVLRRNGFHNVEELRAGDYTAVESICIGATHADHDGARYPFGPEGDALGYMLQGGSTVYFAGDTDLYPEMSSMAGHLDVALLPVWGWGPTLGEGHMNPRSAAESLQLLQPRAAMPIHWGTFAPMGLSWFNPRFLHAPPYDFAQHAFDLAPEVDVHVVHPGHNLSLVH